MSYDVIIVGLGPAGIANAIYLHRFGFKVLLVGLKESNLTLAKDIENYYGIPNISGEKLFLDGIDQAKRLGIEVIEKSVLSIEKYDHFYVHTKDGILESDKVVLATGKMRNKLTGLNYQGYEGNGLSYCASCDAFFYKNKNVGIIGSEDYMYHELSVLEPLCKSITIFTNGIELVDDKRKVVTAKISEFYGKDRLEGIKTSDGATYDLDGVFVAIGTGSTFDFVNHLGIATSNSSILVNNYETNCEGLYAIGDAIGGILQITKATYDGMALAYILREERANGHQEA